MPSSTVKGEFYGSMVWILVDFRDCEAFTKAARAFVLPLCLIILPGCDLLVSNEEQAFRICETHIKEQLRAPATYARVKAIADVAQPGKNIRTVHIEYDASNAFGTPVRGVEGCAFEVVKMANSRDAVGWS